MRVTVRLFAGLRELAGTGERELELAGGARVADVWPALELGEEPGGLLYAVNRQYAPAETELAEGDEVALIPPVSGGAFRLTEEPIDPNAVIREVSDERSGGMAEQVMAEIADALKGRYDLCEVPITHRVGRVDVGSLSVVIAVSAPH